MADKYGNVDAQYTLGVMCDGGQGVPQRLRTVRNLVSKASGHGHAGAKTILNLHCSRGTLSGR